jgi:small nuclear ribonucleoprotein (snRNP)-like protein
MVDTNNLMRPLDFLGERINKEVIVTLKAYKEYSMVGRLVAFDLHLNLILIVTEDKTEAVRFVKGDNIIMIDGVD